MARIALIEVNKASGKTEQIFSDIKNAFGMVPNLFKALANKPEILEANWNKVKAVMMQGELSRELKEMVAVVVSRANGCQYCVDAHGSALKMMGVPRDKILQIIENVDSAELDTGTKKVLNFAVKATREPGKISDSEMVEIKELGYSDSKLVELLSVVDLFTSFNILLLTCDVEIDFPGI